MSRRNSTDDLLRIFLNDFRLNLLSIPRENAFVGDTYVESPAGLTGPGNLRYLLTPKFEMPAVRCNETMSAIDGTWSQAIDLNAGFNLLQGFFTALGIPSLGGIKAAYESKQVRSLRFTFKEPVRDSVDQFEFGAALMRCRLDQGQPFVKPGNRYYVATAVARSRSITVAAGDEDGKNVKVDADVLKQAVGGSAAIEFKPDNKDVLIYEGPKALAFGLELLEMSYNDQDHKFTLTAIKDPHVIRLNKQRVPGAFIGDAKYGNAFISIAKNNV